MAFDTREHAVLILWQEEKAGAAHLAPPAWPKGRWLDLMGRKLSSAPATLSTSPVYLVGRRGQAQALLQALRLDTPRR